MLEPAENRWVAIDVVAAAWSTRADGKPLGTRYAHRIAVREGVRIRTNSHGRHYHFGDVVTVHARRHPATPKENTP